ncbi:hypothetical protein FO519_004346 [Halicephalobus sp. NKZ332]|nr:hypothetical protein FO519_004346 [Halicephalobus sp. NKZ332]
MNTVAMRTMSGPTSHGGLCAFLQEGFSVRQGHLAPPMATPDSPRPQKTPNGNSEALPTTLTIPSEKKPESKPKSPKPQRAQPQ